MEDNSKVEEILCEMTLDEKIGLLSGKNNSQTKDFLRYGIPSLTMADGPCGLRKQNGEGDHLGILDSVPATAAVSGGCLAATWNPECAYENGRLLGEEAALEDVDILLAPAMNIVRTPLCGRNFEYFSEDPYLTGQIASAYTKGVQSAGVGACPKHFAANNQETEREYVDARVDERTLRELYLPAFEEVVREAGPVAVMTALNKVNGEYGAQNRHLLKEILREEWGFDGITISDWYGVVHQEKAVRAGLDLEMPYNGEMGRKRLKRALEEGTLTEKEIDDACLRILTVQGKLREWKKTQSGETQEEIMERHHHLCRKIAEEGIVLLKNEEKILPLKSEDSLAVIGTYAAKPKITLDGSARVVPFACDVPLEKIKELSSGEVLWSAGVSEGNPKEDAALMKETIDLARRCDKVVFFMGQADGVEMEGKDKKDLSMPASQEQLLDAILSVNRNVIVILLNASAVTMPWSKNVKGIFECFLAGQGFGQAIANLLFGVVNPSGKLPVSFTDMLEDTSAYLFFPGDGRQVEYKEGVFCGYRYYDKRKMEVLYPFGYGLSYTDFEYASLKTAMRETEKGDKMIQIQVQIKNTGSYAGAEVVQLYVGTFDEKVQRPSKELKRFHKIFLEPGECRTVEFILTEKDFAYYDTDFGEWYMPEGEYEILIGSSSRDIRLADKIWMVPQRIHRLLLTGWSTMGELRKTPAGEKYFAEIRKILELHMPEHSPLFPKENLCHEEKLCNMPLRFVNLLSDGRIDSDCLLEWIDEVNRER